LNTKNHCNAGSYLTDEDHGREETWDRRILPSREGWPFPKKIWNAAGTTGCWRGCWRDQAVLELVGGLKGDATPLGQAVDQLAAAASAATPAAVDDEYHDLFIGMGRGELVPFGSFYLTGFLHEKPLAVLRQDMERLGIARAESVKEPEDHIATLCEIMAGLIEGQFGRSNDLKEQSTFFTRHVVPWAEQFFQDLENAKTAKFYRPVGSVGRTFMSIESAAMLMAA
jgi:TorA maturation chaperone TorD